MTSSLTKNDKEILTLIGEYQALTIKQLSILSRRSAQVVRRRIRSLTKEELITSKMHGYERDRGRPEDLFLLTKKGMAFLADEGIPSSHAPDKAKYPLPSNHLLLVNWFRIHLLQIERSIPQLSVKYLAPNSYSQAGNKSDSSSASPTNSKPKKNAEFIPDGIFSITNMEPEKKALLFFLEVDMGTETIVSQDWNSKDIRQKILNYQTLFQNGNYKRYESVFNSTFNGFRLLFLVNSPARLTSLCGLVREMRPSDFIWLVDQGRMFSQGLSANIWARGGRDEDPPQSILGPGLACELPL